MPSKKIKGKIIRILDKRTVIINLGIQDGIKNTSIFHILGKPETVIDPFTETELGIVNVSKSRVRASQVFEKFTIATTLWYEAPNFFEGIIGFGKVEKVDEGELLVNEEEIQPWKATTESPVVVGDDVEVSIETEIPETKKVVE